MMDGPPGDDDDTIIREGLDALFKRLGPVRAIRFIRICDQGTGDYTSRRGDWIGGLSMQEIAARARDADGIG